MSTTKYWVEQGPDGEWWVMGAAHEGDVGQVACAWSRHVAQFIVDCSNAFSTFEAATVLPVEGDVAPRPLVSKR